MKRQSKEPGAGRHPDKGENSTKALRGGYFLIKDIEKGRVTRKKRLRRYITGQIR